MKTKSLGLGLALVGLVFSETMLAATPLTKWEKLEQDEDKDNADMIAEISNQIKNDYAAKGLRSFRDTHSHSPGCVMAKFTVNANLPKQYQTGVYAEPGKTFESLIRFSSGQGPAADTVKDARGMAIKLMGVPGPKLLAGQENASTVDFILNDFAAFPTRTSRVFFGTIKLRANPAGLPGFLFKNPIEHALAIKTVIDVSANNPFNGKSLIDRRWHSNTPYLLKSSTIELPSKFAVNPCTPVPAHTLNGTPNQLRDDLQDRLKAGDICLDFSVQLYKEGAGFIVEDGTNIWSEAVSPFVSVAKITIPKQNFVSDEKLAYCDSLSFQPWHTLAVHQPLGNLNRSRKVVYEAISKFRHGSNGELASLKEPENLTTWNNFKSTEYSKWNAITLPAK